MEITKIEESFVERHLKYDDLIPVVEQALCDISRDVQGDIEQPMRTAIRPEKTNRSFLIMPIYSRKDDIFALKLNTASPGNTSRGLPVFHSNIWLYDGTTGAPKANIAGSTITVMRTAAASAVATMFLAPKDSKIHTILGAGRLAGAHVEALATVCNFNEVRIWNHNFQKGEELAKNYGAKAYKSAEEAVRGADVITTVTSSPTPVLFREWVKQGAHINAVGSWVSCKYELEPALMRESVVYTDSRISALIESGDIIHSQASIFAEIGEVAMGTAEAKRDETTVYESLGIAMEDLVAAKMIYEMFEKLHPKNH